MSEDRYDKATAALVGRKLHALADDAYDPTVKLLLRNAAHAMEDLTGFTRPEDYVEDFRSRAWRTRAQEAMSLEAARHEGNEAKAYEAAAEACRLLVQKDPEAACNRRDDSEINPLT